MQKLKTAVLSHGRHLQAREWEQIVWGEPPHRLGQVPKAVLTALEFDADIIIFSTGASRDEETGLLEGEYTLEYARKRLGELVDSGLVNVSLSDLRSYLDRVARLELESQNTEQEILYSARMCQAEGVERIVLCSAPTHIERVHRDALVVLGKFSKISPFKRHLLTVASEVPYANSTPADVVIIEPPHHGDRPDMPVHKIAARMLTHLRRSPHFFSELERLIQKYEQ